MSEEAYGPRVNQVVRALYRPTTIAGLRSECFWITVVVSLAAFSLTKSLLIPAGVGGVAFRLGMWITGKDRQIVRVVAASLWVRTVYDSRKPSRVEVVVR